METHRDSGLYQLGVGQLKHGATASWAAVFSPSSVAVTQACCAQVPVLGVYCCDLWLVSSVSLVVEEL